MKYTLYTNDGIIFEGNNKAEIIKKCNKLNVPATVEDNNFKGIIYENKHQRVINNR